MLLVVVLFFALVSCFENEANEATLYQSWTRENCGDHMSCNSGFDVCCPDDVGSGYFCCEYACCETVSLLSL